MQLAPRLFTCKSLLGFGTSRIACVFQFLNFAFERFFLSISAIFNQLPCLGV